MSKARTEKGIKSHVSGISRLALDTQSPVAGFTLIEVLVALALVGTIATLVYGSITASSQAVDLYSHRLACTTRTSLVLRLMARQIRCAYLPPSTDAPPSPPRRVPAPHAATFRVDSHTISGTALSFLTTGGPGGGPDQPTSLSRILYRHDPTQGTLSIVCEPYLHGAGAAQEPPSARVILDRVKHLDVQCYDGRAWQSQWDAAKGTALPQAIRITLTVVDDRDRTHEFRTLVAIAGRRMADKKPAGMADKKP